MDMNTIEALVPTADPDQYRDGDAWLAGGTVLFSYGSRTLTRLLDITAAGWKAVTVSESGIEFAATCTIAELHALPEDPALPGDWKALDLVRPACDSFVASFKIWNLSTMGGNIATSLPAGPVISLCSALDAVAEIHGPAGTVRRQPVAELVTGNGTNTLAPGELIRSLHVPAHALRARTAFRRLSLTNLGRTGVMVIGRVDDDGLFTLTVSGSTTHPVQLRFAAGQHPGPAELLAALKSRIAPEAYHDDIHGRPPWREEMTHRLGLEVLAELLPVPRTPIEG
ncbi:FAD binding domain-containing protein [Paeniglutamicibacter sp. R2-26]|uniref:FAD binding domain-containing protein n=1 Tax=Paeniglutamicibacter sp. R2-26 TaxID=3144417 RepID=UPI003EE5E169